MGSLRQRLLPWLLVLGLLVMSSIVFAPSFVPIRATTPTAIAVVAETATRPPAGTPPSIATSVLPPALTPTLGRRATRDIGYVPILMYHYVREVDQRKDPLGFRLSVRPDRFAEQVAWLHANNYTPMRMSDLAACLRGQQPCPERPVALTFDDGYEDNAINAARILRRHNFPATFYIITRFVGKPGYMSWEQLEMLRDSGMEIGAHSLSHADLTGLSLNEARREIERSRRVLERRLGIQVLSFSYPAGKYTPEIAAIVHEAGYSNAVTTRQIGGFRRLYELPRRRVLGGETIQGYSAYFVPIERRSPSATSPSPGNERRELPGQSPST